MALRDWAKEKVAGAIWQNLSLQDTLPHAIVSSSLPIQQIWTQKCEKYFPPDAREKVAQAIKKRRRPQSRGI